MSADRPFFIRSESIKVDPSKLRQSASEQQLNATQAQQFFGREYGRSKDYIKLGFGWAMRRFWASTPTTELPPKTVHRSNYSSHHY